MVRYLTALRVVAAAACLDAMVSPSSANDSSAELAVGGLTFTKNADISIESEDLTIALDAITVRYRFLNQSAKPVTLTVAFPLPDIDLADAANVAFPAGDPLNFVGFSTKIDGKPISFVTSQQAVLDSRDVTAKLNEMGIPVFPVGSQQIKISELPQKTRERAIAEGLLVESAPTTKACRSTMPPGR
jgi:hypothetical protein